MKTNVVKNGLLYLKERDRCQWDCRRGQPLVVVKSRREGVEKTEEGGCDGGGYGERYPKKPRCSRTTRGPVVTAQCARAAHTQATSTATLLQAVCRNSDRRDRCHHFGPTVINKYFLFTFLRFVVYFLWYMYQATSDGSEVQRTTDNKLVESVFKIAYLKYKCRSTIQRSFL